VKKETTVQCEFTWETVAKQMRRLLTEFTVNINCYVIIIIYYGSTGLKHAKSQQNTCEKTEKYKDSTKLIQTENLRFDVTVIHVSKVYYYCSHSRLCEAGSMKRYEMLY